MSDNEVRNGLKKPTIEVLLIDDSKIPDFVNPDIIARTLRSGIKMLESFEVDMLALDYYLDNRFTGRDILSRLKYHRGRGRYTVPKGIILVSSESECNDKMVPDVIALGYVRDNPHPKHKYYFTLKQ